MFKNGPSKIYERESLKYLKGYDLLKADWPYPFKYFKGCFPQILLGPFLNALSQTVVRFGVTLTELNLKKQK